MKVMYLKMDAFNSRASIRDESNTDLSVNVIAVYPTNSNAGEFKNIWKLFLNSIVFTTMLRLEMNSSIFLF